MSSAYSNELVEMNQYFGEQLVFPIELVEINQYSVLLECFAIR